MTKTELINDVVYEMTGYLHRAAGHGLHSVKDLPGQDQQGICGNNPEVHVCFLRLGIPEETYPGGYLKGYRQDPAATEAEGTAVRRGDRQGIPVTLRRPAAECPVRADAVRRTSCRGDSRA